jgi:hypothetical protein
MTSVQKAAPVPPDVATEPGTTDDAALVPGIRSPRRAPSVRIAPAPLPMTAKAPRKPRRRKFVL